MLLSQLKPVSCDFDNVRSASPLDNVRESKSLVIIERRTLVRGFLGIWVRSFGHDFTVTSVADAEASLSQDALAQATMAIVGVSTPMLADPWLDRQLSWLRTNRADLPVAVIADSHEGQAAGQACIRLCLQGYIPTSSSMAVAAAALQLVAAGGIYHPQARDEDEAPEPASCNPGRQLPAPAAVAKLTPREQAVLDLLEQGMPNKIIAYRLGLSQSTVKAHVHSIIAKLNVRNRTEAAVASRFRSQVVAAGCTP